MKKTNIVANLHH